MQQTSIKQHLHQHQWGQPNKNKYYQFYSEGFNKGDESELRTELRELRVILQDYPVLLLMIKELTLIWKVELLREIASKQVTLSKE